MSLRTQVELALTNGKQSQLTTVSEGRGHVGTLLGTPSGGVRHQVERGFRVAGDQGTNEAMLTSGQAERNIL